MNNSTGFITLWEPSFQTGSIAACTGPSSNSLIAFRLADIADQVLKQKLAASPQFGPLDVDCAAPPPGAISVGFLDAGTGFALNIVAQP